MSRERGVIVFNIDSVYALENGAPRELQDAIGDYGHVAYAIHSETSDCYLICREGVGRSARGSSPITTNGFTCSQVTN